LRFYSFDQDDESESSEPQEERDDLINPFWVEDSKNLGRGEIDYLSGAEVQFWKDLIDKYLFPLDADSKKQVTF
jgi:chitin synthase